VKKLNFKNVEGTEYYIKFRKPDKRSWGEDCDGVCFYPINGRKTHISVNPHRTDQTIFNTIIHEVTHAFFDDKTEKETTKFANTLSRILYNGLKFRSKNLQKRIKKL
jgi:hypothetical protein